MKEYKHYNTLVKCDDGVYLCDSSDIKEVVYGNDTSYAVLYKLDDGIIKQTSENDEFEESDFDNLYEDYTDFDSECGHEKFEFDNELDFDKKPYAKANWYNYEHYKVLTCCHGINETKHDVTKAKIIEGECFEADDSISQHYPDTELQCFFKFVATDGSVYYINRTSPFFSEQIDDCFEIITKEEFEQYD